MEILDCFKIVKKLYFCNPDELSDGGIFSKPIDVCKALKITLENVIIGKKMFKI